MSRRKVDLPEPDGPTRKTNSPFSTSRLTFSSAGRLWLVYVLVTLSKWITGPSHALDEIRTPAAAGHGNPPLPAFPAGRCAVARFGQTTVEGGNLAQTCNTGEVTPNAISRGLRR